MESDRKQRKRITDRESQRASRARKKEYVSRLESLVRGLTAESSDDRTATLANKVLEQQDEINRLRRILMDITKLSSAAAASGASTIGSSESPAELPAPETLAIEGPESPTEEKPTKITFFGYSLEPGSPSDDNYWALMNSVLRHVETCARGFVTYLSEKEEEDIMIRAIVHGWPAVQQKYELDIVWHLLQAMDISVFAHRTGEVERLSLMRVGRSLLLHKIDPEEAVTRTAPLPGFLKRTQMQEVIEHDTLIDYFVWPSLRDALIITGASHVPADAAADFATCMRFLWPYELRDAYLKPSNEQYEFSETFKRAIYDLNSFRISEDYLRRNPALTGLIHSEDDPIRIDNNSSQNILNIKGPLLDLSSPPM